MFDEELSEETSVEVKKTLWMLQNIHCQRISVKHTTEIYTELIFQIHQVTESRPWLNDHFLPENRSSGWLQLVSVTFVVVVTCYKAHREDLSLPELQEWSCLPQLQTLRAAEHLMPAPIGSCEHWVLLVFMLSPCQLLLERNTHHPPVSLQVSGGVSLHQVDPERGFIANKCIRRSCVGAWQLLWRRAALMLTAAKVRAGTAEFPLNMRSFHKLGLNVIFECNLWTHGTLHQTDRQQLQSRKCKSDYYYSPVWNSSLASVLFGVCGLNWTAGQRLNLHQHLREQHSKLQVLLPAKHHQSQQPPSSDDRSLLSPV